MATGEFPRDERLAGEQAVAQVIPEYIRLFGEYLAGSAAKAEAPVPLDPAELIERNISSRDWTVSPRFHGHIFIQRPQAEPLD
jgi:hypothetical protein